MRKRIWAPYSVYIMSDEVSWVGLALLKPFLIGSCNGHLRCIWQSRKMKQKKQNKTKLETYLINPQQQQGLGELFFFLGGDKHQSLAHQRQCSVQYGICDRSLCCRCGHKRVPALSRFHPRSPAASLEAPISQN